MHSILLALQRGTHVTLHRLASELAGLRLTSSEISALANLAQTQASTVSDLAAGMGIRPTTLTSVLDRLEQRGYLHRRPHPRDRRSTLLELTEPGRDCARTVRKAMNDLEQRALGHVSPTALDHFQQVLDALTEAATERQAHDQSAPGTRPLRHLDAGGDGEQ